MHYCTVSVNAPLHGDAMCKAAYQDGMTEEDWPRAYVRRVLAQTGLSPTALAERVGVSSTTLTRPLNSPEYPHSISRRTLDKIRAVTGIDFEPHGDDAGSEGSGAVVSAASSTALVPVFDVAASAGNGTFIDYEPQAGALAFTADYLRRLTSTPPSRLAIISVKGESMEPTLLDDDVVMMDASKTSLAYDGLFVLQLDGALHVKRVSRGSRPGTVMILSDNKAVYPPVERAIEDVHVIGKVLWYGRKV